MDVIIGAIVDELAPHQYCPTACQAEPTKYSIRISLSEKSNRFNNTAVETFFKTSESELD